MLFGVRTTYTTHLTCNQLICEHTQYTADRPQPADWGVPESNGTCGMGVIRARGCQCPGFNGLSSFRNVAACAGRPSGGAASVDGGVRVVGPRHHIGDDSRRGTQLDRGLGAVCRCLGLFCLRTESCRRLCAPAKALWAQERGGGVRRRWPGARFTNVLAEAEAACALRVDGASWGRSPGCGRSEGQGRLCAFSFDRGCTASKLHLPSVLRAQNFGDVFVHFAHRFGVVL